MATLSAMNSFMPILAFLFVFIVIYALLKKNNVLGTNSNGVSLFISFILASFFIVESSLVEFVRFSSAWFAVIVVGVFFLMAILAFLPAGSADILSKGKWFAWVILGLIIGLFIIASSYVFNWVFNWGMVVDWFDTEWFGMILLLVVAGFVSWKIK